MNISDPTETFRQEARELLDQLEAGLLDLEQDPSNSDLINSTFRALHTIKGSGAMFGFTAVAEFVHEFETAFDRVRKGQSQANAALIQVALDARDHIHRLIEEPGSRIAGGDAILARLRLIVEGGADDSASLPPAEPASVEPTPAKGAENAKSWRLIYYLPGDALLYGTNPLLLLEELAQIGPLSITALTDRIPNLDALDPETPYIGWQVDIVAENPTGAIDDLFLFLRDSMELTLVRLDAGTVPDTTRTEAVVVPSNTGASQSPPTASEHAAPSRTRATDKPESAAATSLRVPAERLDELMDRVGELVIAQARLCQIAAQSSDSGLKTIAEELERLSSGLRDTTMGIRMVPIDSLFGRFRRLIHDLSSELGKPIDFITAGEDTELDKTMIERLADPLGSRLNHVHHMHIAAR